MLTERQRLILAAIIQDYAKTGKAVGSKTLLEELGLAVSSATVRNEMASLEEQGLLQKEHTSSGRVPSQRGYRYYVDKIMRSERMTQVAQQSLEPVSYTHLRAHETDSYLVCRLLLEKKKKKHTEISY